MNVTVPAVSRDKEPTSASGAALYRPPAPVPTTPIRALIRGIVRSERDMLSLMPAFAYQTLLAPVGWTRRTVLMVNDPAMVHAIMTERFKEYPKNDLMVGALEPLVGDSVFVSSGATWERQRRMIDPAFSHMRVNHAFRAMTEALDAFLPILDQRAKSGETFSIEEAMSHLTADIICRTIFSRTLESKAAREIYQAFAIFQDSVANVQVLRLWLGKAWAKVDQPREVMEAARNIRHHIGELVDERMADPDGAYSDIVGDVMAARDPVDGSAFTRDELIDQIGVFFLAGHETTAGALAWALFILSQQPGHATRIRSEVARLAGDEAATGQGSLSIEQVKKLDFTRNVFRETLRLYPPLAFMPRVALEPGQIGHIRYPKGAMLLISPWLVHRHEKVWENADRFDPDRFTPERDRGRAPGSYLPFGLGPRVCVGAAFALIEAVLILARVVTRYDIEAVEPERVRPAARLTTRSQDDILCRLARRA